MFVDIFIYVDMLTYHSKPFRIRHYNDAISRTDHAEFICVHTNDTNVLISFFNLVYMQSEVILGVEANEM